MQKIIKRLAKRYPQLNRQFAGVVAVLIVTAIGTAILVSSHAAAPYASVEAEGGALGGGAISQTAANASNGHYVQFGSTSGGAQTGTRQDWPCSGCITHIPTTYNPSQPTAILVALHGDEGNPSIIEPTWQPVTDQNNVILFTPHCPINLGCLFDNGNGTTTSSWWGWLQSSPQYDDSWIGNQVATIAKSYNLNTSREYLTGWSGGADYLGYYALLHGDQFAAVNYVVGGVPYVQSCPAGHMAAYFLMGSADFRYQSGQPSQVKNVFDSCGDETQLVVLQGADHQGTIDALTTQNYASTIMTWFLAHKLSP